MNTSVFFTAINFGLVVCFLLICQWQNRSLIRLLEAEHNAFIERFKGQNAVRVAENNRLESMIAAANAAPDYSIRFSRTTGGSAN